MVPTRRLVLVLLAAAALAFGWFDVRQRARLDRGLSRHRTDFTVYTAASKAMFEGADPYEARSPRGWRYVYPPLLAILVRPLLDLPTEDAAFLWYLLSVAALALAAVATARAIGPPAGPRSAGLALVVCAGFLVQTFQRGQVTILLVALQAGAVLAFLRGRDVAAGLLLAVGAALRLTPLLLAGMMGIACLRRLVAGQAARAWRFPAGLAGGLLLAFVAVPVAALGADRAREVTARWVESGREMYAAAPGDLADLRTDYAVNEDSFKNQGVRRVLATWTAWATGASIDEDGRADLASRARVVDAAALVVALAVVAAAAWLGWARVGVGLGDPARLALALGVLLPVLATRYAWPVHYVVAVPFVAEMLARGRRGVPSVAAFAAGALLFYAAHEAPLRWPASAGVLLVGTVVAILLARLAAGPGRPAARRPAGAPTLRRAILGAYPDRDPARRLYRSLRLAQGGYEDVARHLPRHGLVVDLGAGEGLLAHLLARTSGDRRVLAVDHDPARVERLRASARGLAIDAVASDLREFRVPPCDAVVLLDVLHYFDRDTQEVLLRGAAAALRPGGTLLLRDPDAGAGPRFAWNALHEDLATRLRATRARVGAYRTGRAWEVVLKAAGLANPRSRRLARLSPWADRVVAAAAPPGGARVAPPAAPRGAAPVPVHEAAAGPVRCRVCGSDRRRAVLRHPEGTLARCRACGVVAVTPLPERGAALALYDATYFRGERGYRDYEAEEGNYRREFRRRLARIRAAGGRGRLLDVGAATGALLLEARAAGFDAPVGVEPCDAVAERGRARGLDVRTASVETADLPAGAFDVVTCFDALEHMTEPVAALRRMGEWLAPGGLLAVTVPDFGGWWSRLSGRYWPFVTPWEHLHYFERRSLRATLRAAGLAPASVERAGTPVSFGTLAAEVDAIWETEFEGLLAARAARGVSLPFGTLLALAHPR